MPKSRRMIEIELLQCMAGWRRGIEGSLFQRGALLGPESGNIQEDEEDGRVGGRLRVGELNSLLVDVKSAKL
jgi:hypothetical protein